MKFLDPTNDFAFKKVFGNENKKTILISFLNSVLDRRGEDTIADVILLNPYQIPHLKGAKETIVDVRCRDQKGYEYIVEMQVLKKKFFDKRVLYYASKAYHTQLGQGRDYTELNPVIFLGILNFPFTENSHWVSTHRIYDLETKEHVLRDFDFTFVELPKFTKEETELETVSDNWIYFLKHAKELQAVPEVIVEEAIKEAFEVVNSIGWTSEELDAYDRRKMALVDTEAEIAQGFTDGRKKGLEDGRKEGLEDGRKEGLEDGRKKGLEDGRKKGLEEGRKKGIEEGIEEGRQREAERLSREMMAEGIDVTAIQKLTGIDVNQL